MTRNVRFQLDLRGGANVLQRMAASQVSKSANAIANRAQSMANSMSRDAPTISARTSVGTIKRGQRAIGSVTANASNARQRYIAIEAIKKATDAGRVA